MNKILLIITGFVILLSCSNNTKTSQKTDISVDSIDAFRELLTPIIGKVHIPYHRLDKPMVQVSGDIAILTFTDIFALNTDSVRWHATEVYQCRNNEWKLIHSHWSESMTK